MNWFWWCLRVTQYLRVHPQVDPRRIQLHAFWSWISCDDWPYPQHNTDLGVHQLHSQANKWSTVTFKFWRENSAHKNTTQAHEFPIDHKNGRCQKRLSSKQKRTFLLNVVQLKCLGLLEVASFSCLLVNHCLHSHFPFLALYQSIFIVSCCNSCLVFNSHECHTLRKTLEITHQFIHCSKNCEVRGMLPGYGRAAPGKGHKGHKSPPQRGRGATRGGKQHRPQQQQQVQPAKTRKEIEAEQRALLQVGGKCAAVLTTGVSSNKNFN